MPQRKKVYLSGPMRNIDDHNFPAFFVMEERLKRAGYEVMNPARNGSMSLKGYLIKDSVLVANADIVAVLHGWMVSEGAKVEVMMANYLGVPVYYAADLVEPAKIHRRVVAKFNLSSSFINEDSIPDTPEWPVIDTKPDQLAGEDALADWVRRNAPVDDEADVVERFKRLQNYDSPAFPAKPLTPVAPVKTRFEELLGQMQELHDRKKSDYTAGAADILFNYRSSGELAGIGVVRSIFARMCEKVVRISSILKKGGQTSVTDETVLDTCLDTAIIALLLRIAFEQEAGATAGYASEVSDAAA